jgi:ribosomal protein S18 acetylase RimI-like enzyme
VLADLPRLAALFDAYRQFQGRGPDVAAAAAFLRDRFDLGESIVFLAETGGGEAAGFTQLYPSFSSVALARTFILNDLFVASDHRRSGVATALLDAAVAHAGSLGAVRVSLNTAVGNTTAQALYEARGWSRDREFFAYHFVPHGDAESAA